MSQPETSKHQAENVTLIPIKRVCDRVGLSRATVYRLIDSQEFPRPVKLSAVRVAWVESEINAWIAEKLEARA